MGWLTPNDSIAYECLAGALLATDDVAGTIAALDASIRLATDPSRKAA
jgi:hypothetical protein